MSETYRTRMRLTGRNTGVPVPPEVLEALGGGRRPRVTVAVGGYVYRSTVGAMGGEALIPFSAEHRAASGIAGGDEVEVVLALDAEPRETAVPDDLAAALAAAGAADRFAALPPGRRAAQATAVEGAKTAATRARRIDAVVASLAD